MNPWLLVLTSAGVAAFVSGGIALLGQFLERRSRREELIFEKALDMSVQRSKLVLELAKQVGGQAKFKDEVINAAIYYRWLKHLLDNGALPPDALDQEMSD